MSNLSAALAAALQNNATIAALVSGVIAGRNFDLQDSLLAATPFACISVADLPSHEKPYLGSANGRVAGQIEIRCISTISEQKASELADAVKTYLRPISSLDWDGSTIPFGITGWMQTPDVADELEFWIEIITIDFLAAA